MPVPVPVFLLDSNEKFKPLDVASVEDAKLKGRLVDAHGNQTDAPIVLADLPADGGRMNFPPHPEKYERRLENAYGNVGYHRVVEDGGCNGTSTGSGTSTIPKCSST
jgi:hypothetical protein